jgi:methionyl aminopeptidase
VIICRSQAEIERMRVANQLVADVLGELEAAVAPGVTTLDLDRLAERLVRDAGAEPAFKGYRGYPATLCASVNESGTAFRRRSDGCRPAISSRPTSA